MTRVPGIALALVLGTFAIYAQVAGHELLYWDDDLYIFDSDDLEGGLSPDALTRAFTEPYQMAWIPVTKLSLLANHALHGVRPAGYLLGNVALHALASVLLLLALRRLSGEIGPSAFVAAVFAFHPLHVESVAWASERKDVVSGVFWMATLLAYAGYAAGSRSAARYALVLALFSLGLLSKAMLVTLPCVLLLLDFWPLGRLRGGGVARALLEKLPFFALAAATSAVTLAIQEDLGAVVDARLPFGLRITNAIHSYLAYAEDAFWPSGLSAFYPLTEASFSVAGAVVGAIVLLLISAAALRLAASHGYLAVGWLWFLGTLVPVIGLVQVGMQARADRYMYVPLVGLGIVLSWGARDVWRLLGWDARALAALAVASVVALGAVSWVQVGYWRDTETLFRRAVAVTEGNFIAQRRLGDEFARREDWPKAELHYRASLGAKGDYRPSHARLGNTLLRLGRPSDAIVNLEIAARLDPDSLAGKLALAKGLAAAGRLADARAVAGEARTRARERGDLAMERDLAELLKTLAAASSAPSSQPGSPLDGRSDSSRRR